MRAQQAASFLDQTDLLPKFGRVNGMSDYDEYLKETERLWRDLEDRPEILKADALERRIQELVARRGATRGVVLKDRARLIKILRRVPKFPGISEEDVTAEADRLMLTIKSSN